MFVGGAPASSMSSLRALNRLVRFFSQKVEKSWLPPRPPTLMFGPFSSFKVTAVDVVATKAAERGAMQRDRAKVLERGRCAVSIRPKPKYIRLVIAMFSSRQSKAVNHGRFWRGTKLVWCMTHIGNTCTGDLNDEMYGLHESFRAPRTLRTPIRHLFHMHPGPKSPLPGKNGCGRPKKTTSLPRC